MYVCMYVCWTTAQGWRKKKVTQKSSFFSVDFSHSWLGLSETTDHTKILEFQVYVFKISVILRSYRPKGQFQEVQCDKTKIKPNMTKCLKTDFYNPNILAWSVVSWISNTLCKNSFRENNCFVLLFKISFSLLILLNVHLLTYTQCNTLNKHLCSGFPPKMI